MKRPRKEFLEHARRVRLKIAENPGITEWELHKLIPDCRYSLGTLRNIGLVRCEGNPHSGSSKWWVVSQ